ncbi:uncharacterized protein DNG_05932 [Cephalotrichum gorgonifer]|uniref:VOC domain-containing protein n=1 Tax=Cephalotrichum gorgonifer TaxID=2041049 RepID=A0AAE8N1N1_9PEZI|nr:uncharacterized protein DNG_05932 [Cephalotrichum gorgonifer]
MLAFQLLRRVLLASASVFTVAACCGPPQDGPFADYTWGVDEHPPAATLGFNINHFSLLVGDWEASMHFYTEVIGMREMFTYHGNEFFSVTYLGYPSGGRNGTGYQTPLELFRNKNNMQGLIELVYLAPNVTEPPAASPEASSKRTNTFSHFGLIVPDLDAARQRFKDNDVTILADVGEVPPPENLIPIVNAYGAGLLPEGSDEVIQQLVVAMTGSGQDTMIIQDPDGNIIEVQPQD